jgi:flagellar biosynthesis/type III secretory pathway protein FliH
LSHFRTAIASITREFPEIELVDVVEDAALTAPQIVLETSIGRVEGDFGHRVGELEEILRTATSQRAEEQAAAAPETKPA